MDKPVAIVLGGTHPHAVLVEKLKARGYHVVLADYLENPPAKKVADEHVRISTLDKDAVLELARDRSAKLVISTCIDQSNSTCCYVAEALCLPHPYSYETSLDVTDKGRMKRIMVANGIPTSPYVVVSSPECLPWDKIVFPAVVKPVDCNSSKGVVRVDSQAECKTAVQKALELSRASRAVIERFNEGVEIQVDCVAAADEVKVVSIRRKRKFPSRGNGAVLQSFGSVFPAVLDRESRTRAVEIAGRISTAFGLRNTPFFYQAVVSEAGISVLELAPRVGGGLSYYALKNFAGCDSIELAVQSFEGRPIECKVSEMDGFKATNLLYAKAGTFGKVVGLEEAKRSGLVDEFFLYKNPGTDIDGDLRSSNRVAAFVVSGSCEDDVESRSRKVFDSIDILDVNGVSIYEKGLYSGDNG